MVSQSELEPMTTPTWMVFILEFYDYTQSLYP
jgi:hypothetical protein